MPKIALIQIISAPTSFKRSWPMALLGQNLRGKNRRSQQHPYQAWSALSTRSIQRQAPIAAGAVAAKSSWRPRDPQGTPIDETPRREAGPYWLSAGPCRLLAMSLGDLLSETLELQGDYTSDPKSRLMLRRRQLVEAEIVNSIEPVLGPALPSFQAKGSNGKGNPARVPWTRFFDPDHSPAPTDGWYAVYLFDGAGEAVYLSLNQGTTTWSVDRQTFVHRPTQQLLQRVAWAREVLSATNGATKMFDDIDLKSRGDLARVYQFGNVHGIEYRLSSMPPEEQLHTDILHIGRLLELLYEIDANTAYIPGDAPPELVAAEKASAHAAGKARRPSKGQGTGLTSTEQLAVEKHAVKLATEYFVEQGYSVNDTGATESYDLEATLGGEMIYVEVKGTMSLGEQIILTRREVEHHQEHPNNALVVVHSILLDRTQQPPVAYGGTRVVTQPWKIDESGLTVISYRYKIPTTDR